jgi:hypothetical protein
MSLGRTVTYKVGKAVNEAIDRIRVECGKHCKVHWISRRAAQTGDYVVTPNGEIARIEKVTREVLTPTEVKWHATRRTDRRRPPASHRRILNLTEIWPTRGTSLKHTRPGDQPLKAAFRIRMVGRGVADFDDNDEVDVPGGMGDLDHDECPSGNCGVGGPIDEANFPLKSGDLPADTFVTEEGLRRQNTRFGR